MKNYIIVKVMFLFILNVSYNFKNEVRDILEYKYYNI